MLCRRTPPFLLVALFLTGLLFVAGCDKGIEVAATYPARGTAAAPQSIEKIDITYSAEVDSTTATDVSHYSIVGSQSGSVLTADVTAALGEAMTDAVAGIPGLNVTVEENARTVSLRPATGTAFNFALGETVTVKVLDGVTSATGVQVQRHSFSFKIELTQSVSGAQPGTPRVITVVPTPATGIDARPTFDLTFNTLVDATTLTTANIFLSGRETGARTIEVTPNDDAEAESVMVALASAEKPFNAGEKVTLTLTPSIVSVAGVDADGQPTPALPLLPAGTTFTVRNGDLNTANGTFQAPVVIDSSGGGGFGDVRGSVTADLIDLAGNELVVADSARGLVLLQRPGSTWMEISDAPINGTPVGVDLADLDQDGFVEIIVATESGEIQVFGVVMGQLELFPDLGFNVSGGIRDFAVGDLSGDGYPDIACATDSGLFVLSMTGEFTLDPANPLAGLVFVPTGFVGAAITERESWSVEIGALFNEGLPGVVVADSLGAAYHSNTANGLTPVTASDLVRSADLVGAPAQAGVSMVIGDLGPVATPVRREVVFATPQGLVYYTAVADEFVEDDGATVLTIQSEWEGTTFPLTPGPDALALVDLDGDSRDDLVTYTASTGLIGRYSGVDGFLFAEEQQLVAPANLGTPTFAFGDLNGDSGRDIIVMGSSGFGSGILAAQTINVTAAPVNTYSFQVPSELTYSLGAGTIKVPVTGSLSDAINAFTIRMTFDRNELELLRFELDDAVGAATTSEIIEGDVGTFTATELSSGTGQVPLAHAVFALVTEDFGSFTYTLENGTDGRNEVTAGGTTFPVGLSAASGTIEVESDVLAPENVVCDSTTDYTLQQDDWIASHAITVTWEVPAGVTYDDVRVLLDGNLQTTIVGNSATFLNVGVGAHDVEVTGFVAGIQSAPTPCDLFLVSPPVMGPAATPVFVASRTTCAGLDCVLLQWDNANNFYDRIEIFRDGSTTPIPAASNLSGNAEQFSDQLGANFFDAHTYQLVAVQIEAGVEYRSNPITTLLPADSTNSSIDPPTAINAVVTASDVRLTWVNQEFYDGGIEVFRNGTSVANLAGDASSFDDLDLPIAVYNYTLRFSSGGQSADVVVDPVSIALAAPTALSCLPQLTTPPVVDVSWTNPVAYDAVLVSRRELSPVASDWAVIATLMTGTTFYTDSSVSTGSVYEYRLEAELNGVTSPLTQACGAALKHSLRVANLTTTLGRRGERIEIYGNVFGDVDGLSLRLNFPGGLLDFGANPTVLLPSGGSLAMTPTVNSTSLLIEVNGTISAGVERLLAVVMTDVTANSDPSTAFAAVGDRPLSLSDVTLDTGNGGSAVTELRAGIMTVSGIAQFVEAPAVLPAPGESFIVPIYGTFSQTIQSAVVLLEFDPTVIEAEDVAIDSSLFIDLSLDLFDNSAGLVSGPLIPAFGNGVFDIAPSIRLPLLTVQFRVLPGAVSGSDTGIRLIESSGNAQPPAYTVTVIVDGLTTTTTVLPDLFTDEITVSSGTSPVVTAFQPIEGSIYGGGTAQIFGSNLSGSGLSVFLGSTQLNVVTTGFEDLLVDLPPLSDPVSLPLTQALVVTHSGGSFTFEDAYTYLPAVLTSVSPDMGIAGQVITVSGDYFPTTVADVEELWVGDVQLLPSGQVVVVGQTETQLSFIAPANVAGPATIRIKFADQPELQIDGFEYVGAPSNLAFSATTGPLRGGNVVAVSGDNILTGSTLTFDGVAIPLDASLTFVVPPYSGAPTTQEVVVTATVESPAGLSAETLQYTYQPLTLALVTPAQGEPTGGTAVTITGTGLSLTGTAVLFGANAATLVSATDDGLALSVLSPAGSGTVDVTVTLDDGQSETVVGAFEYESIMIGTITPNAGSVCGGDSVTITGVGLTDVTAVTFAGVAGTSLVVAPGGDSLTVLTPVGAAGTVDVVVETATTAQTLAAAYTYELPTFIRGDVDGSGTINTADLVVLANYILAAGAAPAVLDAADVNDDGAIHAGDVSFLSQYLDPATTVTIPGPFPTAGVDPTPTDPIPDC